MNTWQLDIEPEAVGTGPERRLAGVSDDDLLCLFSYDSHRQGDAERAPTVNEGADDDGPGTNQALGANASERSEADADRPGPGQVILRLGGEAVKVTVAPERERARFTSGAAWSVRAAKEREGSALEKGRSVSRTAASPFELSRWIEAIDEGKPAPARPRTPPVLTPTETSPVPAPAGTARDRPVVMRFGERAVRRDKAVPQTNARLRRAYLNARRPRQRSQRFRWRWMLVSATLSGGLGCAALLVIRWIVQ